MNTPGTWCHPEWTGQREIYYRISGPFVHWRRRAYSFVPGELTGPVLQREWLMTAKPTGPA